MCFEVKCFESLSRDTLHNIEWEEKYFLNSINFSFRMNNTGIKELVSTRTRNSLDTSYNFNCITLNTIEQKL